MKTKIIIVLLLIYAGVAEAQLSFNKFLGIKVSANNTLVGVSAGSAVTTGNKNTYIGRYTGVGRETLSNQVVLSDGDGNIRAINNAGNWLVGQTVDAGYAFDIAGTLRGQQSSFFATAGGTVSIGSLLTNTAKLYVNYGGADIMALNRSGNFTTWMFRISDGGIGIDENSLIIKPHLSTVASDFAIKTTPTDGGVPSFVVTKTENVGIGTPTPTVKLDVVGSLTHTGTHLIKRLGTGLEKSLRVLNTAGTAVLEFATTNNNTNTLIGVNNAIGITTGTDNTGLGLSALAGLIGGSSNTAIGSSTLAGLIGGNSNTAIGRYAGSNIANGSNNVFIGSTSGTYIADGITPLNSCANSILIGNNTMTMANSQTNQIIIGFGTIGNGNNTTTIGSSLTLNTRLYGSLLIGTNTAVSSAIANFSSTTQGVMLPRMTTAQVNAIVSPLAGLTVYNTDLACLCFYDGTAWRKVSHTAM